MSVDNQPPADSSQPPQTPPVPMPPKPTVDQYGNPISPKSRLACAILAWFVGIFGLHRFYVGKVGTGIAQIFTLGGLGIWALVDFILILVGSFKDKEDRLILNWQ
jgi:TM2 domain-containing membrane protein YozV